MDLSLYIHIPFCVKRCNYCDFNTYAGLEKFIPAYLKALKKEIQIQGHNQPEGYIVHTIYIGGGTPSLLSGKEIKEILNRIESSFDEKQGIEISLEANPGTVTREKLEGFLQAGINRLSLGVQSFHEEELKKLGRIHTVEEADEAYISARQAGFENISLDLIYGLPGQNLMYWQESLEHALQLNPNHVSLYSLTIEAGTPLESLIQCGTLPKPDEDLAADMLEWAMARLDRVGYEQYEVSNWTRVDADGRQWYSRHNMQYWLNEDYLGLGAGAHSFAAGTRTSNVLKVDDYFQRLQQKKNLEFPTTIAADTISPISRWEEIQETMMLGLRMTKAGVSDQRFKNRFSFGMETYFKEKIDRLEAQGLVEWQDEHGKKTLRLTCKGIPLGNRVFREFVGNPEVKLSV